MYHYNIHQWILFFFIYCFLGWCFESTYVSLKSKKLVNRGFLHGPFLPIYGSGAIAILFAALPFKAWPVGVYFMGLISATLLEYVVGVSMEAIFRVRYWDYSYQKYNFQGHICLSSSIAWGFFSDLLIYVIHEPIETYVLQLPDQIALYGTFLVSVLVTADFIQSLRTALDIRDLIIQAEKLQAELGHMKRRIEIMDTFIRADLEEYIQENTAELKGRLKDSFQETSMKLEKLHEKLDKKKEEYETEYAEELRKMRLTMEIWRERMHCGYSLDIANMLRRNPSAIVKSLPGLLEDFRNGRKSSQE